MEGRSGYEGGERWRCRYCGREFDKYKGLIAHLRVHKRERGRVPDKSTDSPPTPNVPQVIPVTPPTMPAVPANLQPSFTPSSAQVSSAPMEPPPPWLLMLLDRLMKGGGGGSRLESMMMEKYINFVDKVFSLPLTVLDGFGKGFQEAVKAFAKEAVREELRDLREAVEELRRLRRVEHERREEKGPTEEH